MTKVFSLRLVQTHSMALLIIIYILRIVSILFMYSALINSSICTLFLLGEFYHHPQLRTSLNILIVTVLTVDCIRVFICAPFESYVLIKTWNTATNNCQEQIHAVEPSLIISNFCRLSMSIRSCFNVVQPFSFIAIAYERLRTMVQRNGTLNLHHIHRHHQEQDRVRLKYSIIWIGVSLLLGVSVGLYQAITYSPSHTCYNQSSVSSRIAMIIRLSCILSAVLISGIIYGKIFVIVKKYQRNTVTPVISTIMKSIARRKRQLTEIHSKDLRLAKNTFILFLSFYLCRIPSVLIILVSLIINQQSNITRCYFEELTNFTFQFTFLATITDPIVYIYSQPILREKFMRFIAFRREDPRRN